MSQTNNLKLNKHDNPSTNENPFDIENYLNANWDKIDVKAGELDASVHESEGNISTLQERVTINEDDIETLQSKVITAESDIETLQTEVTELQEDVQNLRNASYKVSGSGTNFSLNNTTKNKFIEFLPGGNTEQTQLSGKNLLNKTEINSGYNVTVTQIENGVKLVGTYYAQIIQNVKKNTNYYLQYITNNIVGSTKLVRIYNGTSTSSGILKEFSNGNGGTFNSGDNEQLLILFYVGLGTSGEVDFLNIQLEEGTTATDYEPYCGRIPSPNPDYPQPIYNVTGDVNVKIQNGDGTKEQNLPFTLAEGQRMYKDSYLSDDGIHNKMTHSTIDITAIVTLSNGNIGGVISLPNKTHKTDNYLLCNKVIFNNSRETGTIYENPVNCVIVGTPTDTFETMREKYNGSIIEYELENEEIEPYNETQASQYNAIKKAMSYNDQTNISSESDEVGMIIDATAVGDINKVISNLLSN